MKFYKILAVALAGALVFAGCTKAETTQQKEEEVATQFSLAKTSATASCSGCDITISLASNVAWTASCSESWVTLSATSGEGTTSITATVAANTGAQRTATIKFAAKDKSAEFTITQDEYTSSDPASIGTTGYQTIADAVAAAKAGDIIKIKGTFKENVKIASSKEVTIQGSDKASDIIAGDVEVMGKATFKNVTIQSAKDITTKQFLDGDDYNAWWGFIIRAGAGSTVTLEDCKVYADEDYAGDTEAGQYISGVFAAQATLNFSNCEFDFSTGKLFAPAQLFECTANISGCTFTTAKEISYGCEEYVIKLASQNTNVVLSNNTFNATSAIYLPLGDWAPSGSLQLGDGTTDNNTYSSRVKKAIDCTGTSADLPNFTITPADAAFNQPTTVDGAPATEASYEITCTKSFSAADMLEKNIDMSDVRISAYDGNNMYFAQTLGPVMAMDALKNTTTFGWDDSWTVGYPNKISSILAIKNGESSSILVGNATGIGNQWATENKEFNIYFFESATATPKKVLTYTLAEPGRMGDYIDFRGTWQDGYILVANGTENNAYLFNVSDGTVDSTPTIYPFSGSGETDALAGMHQIDDKTFLYSRETAETEVYTLEDGALTMTGKAAYCMKTPKVFEFNGKTWIIYRTTNGKKDTNDYIHICEYTGSNWSDFLVNDYDVSAEYTYSIPQTVDNGNYFASLDVYVDTDCVRIGTSSRSNTVEFLEFKEK